MSVRVNLLLKVRYERGLAAATLNYRMIRKRWGAHGEQGRPDEEEAFKASRGLGCTALPLHAIGHSCSQQFLPVQPGLLFSDRMERDQAHRNPSHLPLSIDNNFILQKYRIWASPLTCPGMCWHPTSHSLDVYPSSPPLLFSALLSSITGTPEVPLLVFLSMCSPWCCQFLQNKYNHTHTHNTHIYTCTIIYICTHTCTHTKHKHACMHKYIYIL